MYKRHIVQGVRGSGGCGRADYNRPVRGNFHICEIYITIKEESING